MKTINFKVINKHKIRVSMEVNFEFEYKKDLNDKVLKNILIISF